MNWKSLSFLGILTIGMLVYLQYGVIEKSEKAEAQKESAAKVFHDLNGLKKIILRNTREPEIVLSQEDNRWNLEKPLVDIVSASQLETFLAGLKNLEIKSVLLEKADFESRKNQLEQYGIKPEAYQVELVFLAGPKTLILGDMIGETFDFYAQIKGEDRILIVSQDLESSRTLGGQDWREKKLVNVDSSQILRVSIQREKDTLEFERPAVDKPWEMRSPYQLPLDQEFTNSRLQKIAIVQANQFLDKTPSALQKPAIRVKALFADGVKDARSPLNDPLPQGVEVIFGRSKRAGSKNKDAGDDYDYFAKSDKAPPAQIARFHFENFDRPARDFIEKKFDEFISADVKNFRVWRDGKEILKASRDGDSVSLEANGKSVSGSELSYEKAIQHLRNLVASQFVAPDSKPTANKVKWMVELEMKDKSTRYFAFENPETDGPMWTNKGGSDLRYQFRANALNSKLFTLESLTHPPIESLKKASASKPDAIKKETRLSPSEMPKISLETFVLSIGTATMVALGEMENPMTKKKDENLEAAKQNIDILEMLVEKTKGNLTETENKILTGVLFETRMKFVAKKK